MQLFELIFNQEAYNLIVQQTILYAFGKGEANFLLTVKEIKVVFGILLVLGIVPVSCRRMFWKNSTVTRNEVVFNAMRRNRFEKFLQMLHFADNFNLDQTDKYCKICPLIRIMVKNSAVTFSQCVTFPR